MNTSVLLEGGNLNFETPQAATIAALIKRGTLNETLQLSAGSTPVADAVADLA